MGRTLARLKVNKEKERETKQKKGFREKLALYLLRLAWGECKEVRSKDWTLQLKWDTDAFLSFCSPPHNNKRGARANRSFSRVAGEPHACTSTRSGSPVFECPSYSKPSVFRDSVRGCGSQLNTKSQSLRRTSARIVETAVFFDKTPWDTESIYTLQD